jgi:hypothetical protein
MARLAVIGTFYQRYERTEMLLNRILLESTRPPDEFWMMCEEEDDAILGFKWSLQHPSLTVKVLHTSRTIDNKYAIIPYSNKINWALDHTNCEYVVYLDNFSIPHIEKYRLMAEALDANPEWGAVYCSQNRTGYVTDRWLRNIVIEDAYCVLNYTQIMHRKTDDRWTLDMKWSDPDLADALFWRDLHKSYGSFYPVLLGDEMLDEHHLPSMKADGI